MRSPGSDQDERVALLIIHPPDGFRTPENSPNHCLTVEYYSDADAGEGYESDDLDDFVRLGRSAGSGDDPHSASAA